MTTEKNEEDIKPGTISSDLIGNDIIRDFQSMAPIVASQYLAKNLHLNSSGTLPPIQAV